MTNQTQTPIALQHGTRVRLASWTALQSATVFTIAGYAVSNGEDPNVARDRALAHGHSIIPDTINTGGALHDCAELRQRERKEWEAAVVLNPGDVVLIEGLAYRVEPRQGNEGRWARNSDPIAFRPV